MISSSFSALVAHPAAALIVPQHFENQSPARSLTSPLGHLKAVCAIRLFVAGGGGGEKECYFEPQPCVLDLAICRSSARLRTFPPLLVPTAPSLSYFAMPATGSKCSESAARWLPQTPQRVFVGFPATPN